MSVIVPSKISIQMLNNFRRANSIMEQYSPDRRHPVVNTLSLLELVLRLHRLCFYLDDTYTDYLDNGSGSYLTQHPSHMYQGKFFIDSLNSFLSIIVVVNSGFYYGGKEISYAPIIYICVCVETLQTRIKRKGEQSFSYFFLFTMLLFPRLCVPLLISQPLSLSRSPHTSARECVASSPPDCQHTHTHTLFALNNTYTHFFSFSSSPSPSSSLIHSMH